MQSEAFVAMTLPTGRFELTPSLDDSVRAACAATVRLGDDAHPIFGFVAGLGGAGLKVADILALCGCSIDRGPVLASCELSLPRAMKVGCVYQVDGEISSHERKRSRRFGAADHVDLRFDLSCDGETRGTLRLKMIVPAA